MAVVRAASSERTICPIARTCATNRAERGPRRADRHRQGHRGCWRTSSRPTHLRDRSEPRHQSPAHAHDACSEAARRGCRDREHQSVRREARPRALQASRKRSLGMRRLAVPTSPADSFRCEDRRGRGAPEGHHEGASRTRGRIAVAKCSTTHSSPRPTRKASRQFRGALRCEDSGRASRSRLGCLPARRCGTLAELYAKLGAGDRVLGDGPDAAPLRRRERPGGHEPPPSARQHRASPGAGPCPVRGHSNVQGDRTMGIWESRRRPALPRSPWSAEFRIRSAAKGAGFQHHRGASRRCTRAGPTSSSRWAETSPSADADTRPMPRRPSAGARLTVHVATKLNRTHLLSGRGVDPAVAVPRSDRARQSRASVPQFVDRRGLDERPIHRLPWPPRARPRTNLRSEPAIVGRSRPGSTLRETSARCEWEACDRRLRPHPQAHRQAVIPGFEDFNEPRARRRGLRPAATSERTRAFETPSGQGRASVVTRAARDRGRRKATS